MCVSVCVFVSECDNGVRITLDKDWVERGQKYEKRKIRCSVPDDTLNFLYFSFTAISPTYSLQVASDHIQLNTVGRTPLYQ